MPLGGDPEEKQDDTGRHLPWRVSSESHRLAPSPGVLHQGDKLPWRGRGWLGLTGELWEAWTPLVRSLYWLALKEESTPGHRGHPVLGLSLSGRCLSLLALHSSTAAQISESSHSSPPDTCQGAVRAHPPCSVVHSMGCVWSLGTGRRLGGTCPWGCVWVEWGKQMPAPA